MHVKILFADLDNYQYLLKQQNKIIKLNEYIYIFLSLYIYVLFHQKLYTTQAKYVWANITGSADLNYYIVRNFNIRNLSIHNCNTTIGDYNLNQIILTIYINKHINIEILKKWKFPYHRVCKLWTNNYIHISTHK